MKNEKHLCCRLIPSDSEEVKGKSSCCSWFRWVSQASIHVCCECRPSCQKSNNSENIRLSLQCGSRPSQACQTESPPVDVSLQRFWANNLSPAGPWTVDMVPGYSKCWGFVLMKSVKNLVMITEWRKVLITKVWSIQVDWIVPRL